MLANLYNAYPPLHSTRAEATEYSSRKRASEEETEQFSKDRLRSRPRTRSFGRSPVSLGNHASVLSPARVETREQLTTASPESIFSSHETYEPPDTLPDYKDDEVTLIGSIPRSEVNTIHYPIALGSPQSDTPDRPFRTYEMHVPDWVKQTAARPSP